MEDIDVLFLYEHVARELDVACAVKCLAEQHYGIRIEFEQWPGGIPRALKQFRPKIVVLPNSICVEDFHSVVAGWRKAFFFNLSWEQLLSKGTLSRKMPRDKFTRKHVVHHAWNDDWASFLQTVGVPRENIFINGNPAYMLYEEPYRGYFKQRSELARQYGLDVNKRWIFLPENFGWAFTPEHQVETDWLQRGVSLDQANTMRRIARLSLEETMKWCVAISGDSTVELIIRPRPAVPLDDFRDTVQQIIGVIPDRMRFIKEESVREWIMASDVVISFQSTSLVEAALAGKAAYLLEPHPTPEFLHVNWHDFITHITTEDEFKNACLNFPITANNKQLAEWARTTMSARGDAIWNVADFLAKICRGEVQRPPFVPRNIVGKKDGSPLTNFSYPQKLLRKAFRRLPKWILFEYERIRYKKDRLNEPVTFMRIHENDQPSQIDIDQRTKKWKQVLGFYDARKSG